LTYSCSLFREITLSCAPLFLKIEILGIDNNLMVLKGLAFKLNYIKIIYLKLFTPKIKYFNNSLYFFDDL